MTSLRASNKHEPLSTISEPPSPTEEDLAKPSAWDDDETTSTLVSSRWKGKGKQRDDAGDDDDGEPEVDAGNYPPMAEEDLQTRKVEENLKRWETLEKQRRKVARDALARTSSSSFISDVSRRASQLWNSRSDRDPVVRPHAPTSGHAVLKDMDESLGVQEPPATPFSRTSMTDNPFESPEDPEAHSGTLMTAAGPESLTPIPRGEPEPGSPSLQAQASVRGKHSSPQPLGLSDAEERARQQAEIEEEVVRDKRWWTEWLCGCREGGDHQAGRTNPME